MSLRLGFTRSPRCAFICSSRCNQGLVLARTMQCACVPEVTDFSQGVSQRSYPHCHPVMGSPVQIRISVPGFALAPLESNARLLH
jgi:hypothetical protein